MFHRLRSRVATELRLKEVRLTDRQLREFATGFDDGMRAGYFGTQLYRPSGMSSIYTQAWLMAEHYVKEVHCVA